MTPLPTACPKPTPESETEKRTRRIANARTLQSNRKPIPRKQQLAKSGRPIPKRNAKRAKKNQERAYGDYAESIRQRPCCACGFDGLRSEAAHTTTGGMGRKADAKTLVPLCGPHYDTMPGEPPVQIIREGCHRKLHRIGVKSFENLYGLSLAFHAERLWVEGQQ